MPTRIFFNGSTKSIVVSETLDEVESKIKAAKDRMEILVFYDNENRYGADKRVVVIAGNIDYCKPERVSI